LWRCTCEREAVRTDASPVGQPPAMAMRGARTAHRRRPDGSAGPMSADRHRPPARHEGLIASVGSSGRRAAAGGSAELVRQRAPMVQVQGRGAGFAADALFLCNPLDEVRSVLRRFRDFYFHVRARSAATQAEVVAEGEEDDSEHDYRTDDYSQNSHAIVIHVHSPLADVKQRTLVLGWQFRLSSSF